MRALFFLFNTSLFGRVVRLDFLSQPSVKTTSLSCSLGCLLFFHLHHFTESSLNSSLCGGTHVMHVWHRWLLISKFLIYFLALPFLTRWLIFLIVSVVYHASLDGCWHGNLFCTIFNLCPATFFHSFVLCRQKKTQSDAEIFRVDDSRALPTIWGSSSDESWTWLTWPNGEFSQQSSEQVIRFLMQSCFVFCVRFVGTWKSGVKIAQ